MARRSLGHCYPSANTDGGEGRPSKSSGEAGHIRFTVGGSPLHRILRGLKRSQRYWLRIVSLHKIFQYQNSTELLIHKQPFVCLVCEIEQAYRVHNLCFQVNIVQALQETTKCYLTDCLEDANVFAIHAKCVTIMPKDIQLAHLSMESSTCKSVSVVAGCV